MQRGSCPTAIVATHGIISLLTRVSETTRSFRLECAMTLVRFVNETVDPEQRSSYAQPISRLAEGLGLPRILVDLRHESTHDRLPSHETCQIALDAALQWLLEHYWHPWSGWEEWLRERIQSTLLSIGLEGEEEAGRSVKRQVNRCLQEIDMLETSPEVMRLFAQVLIGMQHPHQDAIVQHMGQSSLFQWQLCQVAVESGLGDALVQLSAPLLKEQWPVKHLLQSALRRPHNKDRYGRIIGILIAGLRIPLDKRLVALYEAFLEAPACDGPPKVISQADAEVDWQEAGAEWRPCPFG